MLLLTFCFSPSYSRAVWKVSENSSQDPDFGCGQVKAAPTKHCVKQFAARERFPHLESRRSKTELPPQIAVLLLQDLSLFPKWRSALCFYRWIQLGNSSVKSCAHRCRRTDVCSRSAGICKSSPVGPNSTEIDWRQVSFHQANCAITLHKRD